LRCCSVYFSAVNEAKKLWCCGDEKLRNVWCLRYFPCGVQWSENILRICDFRSNKNVSFCIKKCCDSVMLNICVVMSLVLTINFLRCCGVRDLPNVPLYVKSQTVWLNSHHCFLLFLSRDIYLSFYQFILFSVIFMWFYAPTMQNITNMRISNG